eukprot:s2217_g4.t1
MDDVVMLQSEAGAERSLKVHVSFICLSGILLNLSKYMVMFKEKLAEAEQMQAFIELATSELEAIKMKQPSKPIYKMAVLSQASAHFAKFASAAGSFANMTGKLAETDAEVIFFKLLLTRMSNYVVQLLTQCNNELGSAWNALETTFKALLASHSFPSMFQGDLDKEQIAKLVGDPNTVFLLHLGSRSAALSEDIKTTLEAIRMLPKDSILTASVMSMVTALQSDLLKFSSSAHQGPPKQGERIVLANFTFFQGSMTLGQCLTRDLKPGETRVGLSKRCLDLLVSKGIKFEDNLKRRVDSLTAGK